MKTLLLSIALVVSFIAMSIGLTDPPDTIALLARKYEITGFMWNSVSALLWVVIMIDAHRKFGK